MTLRPERYRHAIVPHVYVDGASKAIDFYALAFGAKELFRLTRPDGKILHAEIAIEGSVIMLGDPTAEYYSDPRPLGRCTTSLHIFTDDNVGLLARAVKAGGTKLQAPVDLFYGASSASLRDPFGHVWVLLTWKATLDPTEIACAWTSGAQEP